MPPEIAFFFGLVFGVVATLILQWMGRRKVRKALAELSAGTAARFDREKEQQSLQIDYLKDRLAVLERITIDPGHRTAREIDALRDVTN
ncbi:hypothetical protein EAH79_04455 [Sphingomonas koreensis]|nr:hypothetical protein EAH79_04455 [Sphingomonas koreensis]